MDFIFDDDNTAVICLVGDQLIGRLKLDVVDIAPELGHQIGAPLDDARPTREIVEDLVDDVVSDDVLTTTTNTSTSTNTVGGQVGLERGTLLPANVNANVNVNVIHHCFVRQS